MHVCFLFHANRSLQMSNIGPLIPIFMGGLFAIFCYLTLTLSYFYRNLSVVMSFFVSWFSPSLCLTLSF